MKTSLSKIERFASRYSIGGDSYPLNVTGSSHFLRVKVPGGLITSEQFRQVAVLAAKYSKSQMEVTVRQGIQLHWIRTDDAIDIFTTLDELGFTTDMCGQGFGGARYGDVRNIVCCPVSGIEDGEVLDGSPFVERLNNYFVGNLDFLDMPRKFKFSVSGCGYDCTRAQINDLAFVAVKQNNEVGYAILVGGGIGASLPGPRLAKNVGIFVRPRDAFDVAVAAVEIHRDNSNRESKSKARFKWLIENWGHEKFINELEEKLGMTFEKYNGPVFKGSSDHDGVKIQNQEKYHYVNIPLLGGRLTSNEMFLIANLTEEYGKGELRLTPAQNIILPYVEEVDAVLKQLKEMNFQFDGSRLRWNSLGCSSDFCGRTRSPHAKEVLKTVVEDLERQISIELLDKANFRIYVNGCPNNCCPSLISGIGLNGRQVKEGNVAKQTYDILLGGSHGKEPMFGRTVEEKVQFGSLKTRIVSILKLYMKNKEPTETFSTFCNRHTVEELSRYLIYI
jgi:sulfite reductase beta subunit-like hemoprotein